MMMKMTLTDDDDVERTKTKQMPPFTQDLNLLQWNLFFNDIKQNLFLNGVLVPVAVLQNQQSDLIATISNEWKK